MIRVENVTKTYKMGEVLIHALNSVSLKVDKGEFLSIMGPSGSGKTTFLNMIGCIDTPTSGKVFLDGRDVSRLKDKELTKIRLRNIGFIFQQFYLIPTLTALENLELPMKEAKVPREERKKRAMELFEHVDLSHREKHYPNQLSGGEQQRVAIARALANNPKLLLADEPTGEIDTDAAKNIVSLLRRFNEENDLTVVIVTHDPLVAKETKRSVEMVDGKIV